MIDSADARELGNSDLLEPLRTVPGAAVVQTGGRGGTTSLFVRGGSSNFNKVLLDGVPANDIGGAFNFADLPTTGVERVEVLRGANSVVYGSDAMAGVVSITHAAGPVAHAEARRPRSTAATSAPRVRSRRSAARSKRFDYFADYSHLATDNDVPNNAVPQRHLRRPMWRRRSGRTTDRERARCDGSTAKSGSPNAIDLYGIPDDSIQTRPSDVRSVDAQAQITAAGRARCGSASPTRTRAPEPHADRRAVRPFGFGANYLGNAGDGRGRERQLGRPGGPSWTSAAPIPRRSTRRVTRRRCLRADDVPGRCRRSASRPAAYEHEEASPTRARASETERDNYGAFLEARAACAASTRTRASATSTTTCSGPPGRRACRPPAYLREPSAPRRSATPSSSSTSAKGIKAPSLAQELSSLFALFQPATASRTGVEPIGPERSRTLDVGLEQGLARGQLRVCASRTSTTTTRTSSSSSARTRSSQLGVPPDGRGRDGLRRLRELVVVHGPGPRDLRRGGSRGGCGSLARTRTWTPR